jgi:hypothetical protein
MTTLAQTKRVLKPFLGSHPEFELVQRALVIRPIHHVVRQVLIGRTSQADLFRPVYCVMHLFEVKSSIFLNWGSEIYKPEKGSWRWSDQSSIPRLIDLIETVALPQIKPIGTIEDLIDFVDKHPMRHHLFCQPLTKLLFDTALGDLNSARQICAEFFANRTEATYGRDAEDKMQFRRLKELCRRLALDDRAGLAALLHEWEAQTVKNLKLEHLWQPSPFPLELQPAAP